MANDMNIEMNSDTLGARKRKKTFRIEHISALQMPSLPNLAVIRPSGQLYVPMTSDL